MAAAIASASLSATAGERVGDFALIDHEGAFHNMTWYDDHNAVVILPQANGSADTAENLAGLLELQAKYDAQGVEFFLMNPGLQERAAVQAEAASLAGNLPILMDDTQLVSELLGIDNLDQAVVYSPKSFEVLYRGPVGAQLSASLDSVLAGQAEELVSVTTNGTAIQFSATSHQEALSYEKDIAPIIAENCAECHREGGIAPFAMDNHLAVQGWSPMIKEVVMTKRMPPGQVDNKVGLKVQDAMNLEDDEMQKLVHWINSGSAKDGSVDPLTQLTWPDTKWSYGEPDLIVKVPPQSIPATGVVEYMDLPIDLGLEEDVWIRGSEVVPGDPSVLHHIITTVVPPGANNDPEAAFMEALASMPEEQRQEVQGKLMQAALGGQELGPADMVNLLGEAFDIESLLSGGDPDTASVAGYAPGAPGGLLPEGVGGMLKAGTQLSLQMHYTTTGKESVDATEIGIYFYPEGQVPTERMAGGVANNFDIRLPANAKDYEMVTSTTVPEDAYIYSLMPHMHFRGKRMHFTAKYPDGSEELLLSVPNYSFNWQLVHKLEEPKLMPAGTEIVATGAFDNSGQNPYNPDPNIDIKWGEQSWEEMFMGFFDWKYTDQGGSD